METWINGEKVDVKYEEEKTIAEVITSLEKWAETQNFFLQGITIDGEVFSNYFHPTLAERLLTRVTKLEVKLAPPFQVAYEGSVEFLDYLERVKLNFEGNSIGSKEVQVLLEGHGWMQVIVGHILKALNLKEQQKKWEFYLKEIEIVLFRLANLSKSEASLEQDKWVKSRNELAGLYQQLAVHSLRLKQKAFISNNFALISALTKDNVKDFLKDNGHDMIELLQGVLPEAASELQKGKDLQAMAVIEIVVEAFGLLGNLLERGKQLANIEQKSLPEFELFFENIRPKLKELEQAFIDLDYVLLSDLLEYELSELLPEAEASLTEIAELF